ncbi:MAG TPA: MFS transporter [Vicinamibacterales bacterium]|nr:MFS transporter [Vicinamibacterales bacterium]
MNPALTVKNPPPAVWRWAVLVAISVAMFGNYYVYDSIGPVADSLQRLLGFTDTQIGTLNAIYSLPNIIVVLIGGVIVDRFGTRLSTLAFAIICMVGAIITALSPVFPVMAAGRLVFGLGAESMIVAITVAIGQWFVGRQLGFAFGVNLSIARAGSYSADLSTTWFKPLYEQGWQPPLFLAAGMAVFAVVACIVYYMLDRYVAQHYDVPRPSESERFVWSDLWRFDRSFWYVIGLCVTFYSVIFPFRSTFAIKYFQHAHGLSLQDAGALNGYVFLAAIFATPAFGFMADMLGRRAAFMAFGCFLLAAVFPILAYTDINLWVSTVMIGVAFSLVPAVIWPAVPYLVEPKRLGTAYGLMTMVQAMGLTVINLVAGALNDANGAGPENPGGYTPMLWLFLALSLGGFVFAYLLRVRETSPEGHGLEQIKAGAPG